MKQTNTQKLGILLVLTMLLQLILPFTSRVYGAELSEGYIRLDRLKASTDSSGTVCVKPSATFTDELVSVDVTFPSDFTVDAISGNNWDGAGSTLGGATAMPNIGTATPTVSGQTVTWTFAVSEDLTSGTMYCFSFGATGLTTGAAGANKTGTIELVHTGGGASNQSTAYAVAVVAEDQVTVDADVPALFTFTVPDTAMDHGSLSTATVDVDTQSSAMSVQTNAENGWLMWMKVDSTNGFGLYSTTAADTIGDRVADDDNLATAGAGTEDWVISAALGANGTVVAEFDGNETTTGGRLPANGDFEQVASHTTVSAADTVTLTSIAAISAINKAATDYRETLTVVAAGNF